MSVSVNDRSRFCIFNYEGFTPSRKYLTRNHNSQTKQKKHYAFSLAIDGLQSIPGDSKYKDIAAMLVPSTIEANKHSFVKVPPTWPP